MAVERGVAESAAREAGQGGHDHGARLSQRIEERHPARQAAEAGEEAELGPAALGPDTAGETVHLDGGRLRFGQGSTPRRRSADGRRGRQRAGPWPSAWATTCPPSRRT